MRWPLRVEPISVSPWLYPGLPVYPPVRLQAEEETGAKPAQNGTAAGEAGGAPGASADAAPAVPRQRKELAAGPAGGVYIPPFKLAAMLAEVSGGAAGASRDELVCLGRMMSWRGEQAQRGQGYVEVMVCMHCPSSGQRRWRAGQAPCAAGTQARLLWTFAFDLLPDLAVASAGWIAGACLA